MLRVGKEHLFFPSCGCIKAIVFHSHSHFGLLPTSLPRANELLCLPCETFVAMRIPFEASPQCLFRNTLIRFSVIGGFSGLPYCSAIVICSIDLPRDTTRSQSAARRCAAAAPRDALIPGWWPARGAVGGSLALSTSLSLGSLAWVERVMYVLRVQRPWVPIGIAAAAPETLWLWLCLLLRRGSAKGFHGNPQARSPTPDYFILFFFFAFERENFTFPSKRALPPQVLPPPDPSSRLQANEPHSCHQPQPVWSCHGCPHPSEPLR